MAVHQREHSDDDDAVKNHGGLRMIQCFFIFAEFRTCKCGLEWL